MYKYISQKIEDSKGFYFDSLVFLPSELQSDRRSDFIREFEGLAPQEICEALGWNDTKEAHEFVQKTIEEEGGILQLMWENRLTGFLARIHVPSVSTFRIGEDGEPKSWSVHQGVCTVVYRYAHSIEELVEKSIKVSQELFDDAFSQELSERELQKVTQ